MKELSNIIEGLNQYTEEFIKISNDSIGNDVTMSNYYTPKGVFIGKLNIEPQAIKAYKKYIYTVYYVVGKDTYYVLSMDITKKVIDDTSDMYKALSIELAKTLFMFVASDSYKECLQLRFSKV